MEDEQIENELPNLELGSLALTPPEDRAQDIPSRHSTRVRSIPTHLLDYHCYTVLATPNLTPIVRLPLTLYGRLQ